MVNGKADLRHLLFPIQNQGQCGSCTGFGTTGIMEAYSKTKLSEKDLFTCAGGTCNRGNTMANTFVKAKRGVATEACCPYTMGGGQDAACGGGRCAEWWLTGYKVSGVNYISNATQIKELMDAGHPLVATMQVYESFLHYVSGVYHKLPTGDSYLGGHCIGIVGYDDSLGALLLRNSWGPDWGQGCAVDGDPAPGYCWIKYGEIDATLYQMLPNGPVDPDTPSPCPVGNGTARFLSLIAKTLGRKGRFYYRNPEK